MLACFCCELDPGQFSEAGRALEISVETIRQHRHLLADLIQSDDLRGEYIQVRGLKRSEGVLAATSIEDIDTIVSYYRRASVACPGKHDVVTNPDNRSESKQKRNLFGTISSHHRKCVTEMKNEQKLAWAASLLSIEKAHCTRVARFFILPATRGL